MAKTVLNQLFGIETALTETEIAEKKAAAAAGGKLPKTTAPTGGLAGGLLTGIGAAIEAAKQRLLESLGGLWGDIKANFTEKWGEAICRTGEKWDAFKELIGRAVDYVVSKVMIRGPGSSRCGQPVVVDRRSPATHLRGPKNIGPAGA